MLTLSNSRFSSLVLDFTLFILLLWLIVEFQVHIEAEVFLSPLFAHPVLRIHIQVALHYFPAQYTIFAILCLEAIFKFYALGPIGYTRNAWNRY